MNRPSCLVLVALVTASACGPHSSDSSKELLTLNGGCPSTLVAAQGSVYWMDTCLRNVSTVPVEGGTPRILATLSQDDHFDRFFAVAGSFVMWRVNHTGDDRWTLLRVPVSGGEVQTVRSGQTYTADMVLQGDRLLWLASDGSSLAGPFTLLSAGLAPDATAQALASGIPSAFSLAADETAAYWTEQRLNDFALRSVPLAGGAPRDVTVGHGVGSLATFAGAVYWLGSSGQEIWKQEPAASSAELVGTFNPASAFAVGTGGVYVATNASLKGSFFGFGGTHIPGQIIRFDSSGQRTVLSEDVSSTFALALDAASVYWFNDHVLVQVSR